MDVQMVLTNVCKRTNAWHASIRCIRNWGPLASIYSGNLEPLEKGHGKTGRLLTSNEAFTPFLQVS